MPQLGSLTVTAARQLTTVGSTCGALLALGRTNRLFRCSCGSRARVHTVSTAAPSRAAPEELSRFSEVWQRHRGVANHTRRESLSLQLRQRPPLAVHSASNARRYDAVENGLSGLAGRRTALGPLENSTSRRRRSHAACRCRLSADGMADGYLRNPAARDAKAPSVYAVLSA